MPLSNSGGGMTHFVGARVHRVFVFGVILGDANVSRRDRLPRKRFSNATHRRNEAAALPLEIHRSLCHLKLKQASVFRRCQRYQVRQTPAA
jgi:hypothetical protein